jgi:hypothetical protein
MLRRKAAAVLWIDIRARDNLKSDVAVGQRVLLGDGSGPDNPDSH